MRTKRKEAKQVNCKNGIRGKRNKGRKREHTKEGEEERAVMEEIQDRDKNRRRKSGDNGEQRKRRKTRAGTKRGLERGRGRKQR